MIVGPVVLEVIAINNGAARALVQKLDRDYKDKRFILLGDFNDNPDDKSLNILETGDIDAEGGAEEDENAFLSNPAEHLIALDHVWAVLASLLRENWASVSGVGTTAKRFFVGPSVGSFRRSSYEYCYSSIHPYHHSGR